jgi:hypothetical protein
MIVLSTVNERAGLRFWIELDYSFAPLVLVWNFSLVVFLLHHRI